ncbi:Indole-3-acetic acid-induced protein ARG7 [Apostasia shenzhenica]|uniref:Indole-3-acetic acid-induced protein ARG7 n=1 Tax=Apostasia shenzhenica TaxID=1088818 RepID=A0A2I0B8Q5_9ASPA|nr:Indole-3-acetic acid-induced protein ARG7 [Apostasia shenzhenica]
MEGRGFRIGRRLAWVWPKIFCSRRRRYSHLSPERPDRSGKHCAAPATGKKLLRWGRAALRRRVYFPALCCDGAGGGEVLLGKEVNPPPKGHLVVYVGGGERDVPPLRYVVPVIYFNHPLFGELLREAEEEFGFHQPGGITIPCAASRFERIQTRIAACFSSDRRKIGAQPCCIF